MTEIESVLNYYATDYTRSPLNLKMRLFEQLEKCIREYNVKVRSKKHLLARLEKRRRHQAASALKRVHKVEKLGKRCKAFVKLAPSKVAT